MKKINIDGLLGLNLEEIEIVYRRCRGDSVQKVAIDMGISRSTIWNERMPGILKMLEVTDWREIEDELCIPLRKVVSSVEVLKQGWPEAFREKIEDLRESPEDKEVPSGPPPSLPQHNGPPRTRLPWPVFAIPLLLVCGAFIFGVWFVWNRLPGLFTDPPGIAANTESPTDNPLLANPTNTMAEVIVPNLPTETPEPTLISTETAAPTPTPSAIPTQTSIPTLFNDTFNTGIDQAWGMSGDNFNVVEGKLSSLGTLYGVVGDGSWTDYAVEFKIDAMNWSFYGSGLRILIRRQDDSNYMALEIRTVNGCLFRWLSVVGGEEKAIVDTERSIPNNTCARGMWRIEAVGNNYNVIKDFEPLLQFIDNTFENGGTGIFVNRESTSFRLDDFRVIPLP